MQARLAGISAGMERSQATSPPFRWADRYDLWGLVVGAVVACALLLAGGSVWVVLGFGVVSAGLAAYALRRRAGVPTLTIWQRLAQRRHDRR